MKDKSPDTGTFYLIKKISSLKTVIFYHSSFISHSSISPLKRLSRILKHTLIFPRIPPLGHGLLHHGIDAAHADKIPGTLQFTTDRRLHRAKTHRKATIEILHVMPV